MHTLLTCPIARVLLPCRLQPAKQPSMNGPRAAPQLALAGETRVRRRNLPSPHAWLPAPGTLPCTGVLAHFAPLAEQCTTPASNLPARRSAASRRPARRSSSLHASLHAPLHAAHHPPFLPPSLDLLGQRPLARMAKGGPIEAERLSAVESRAEGGPGRPMNAREFWLGISQHYATIPPFRSPRSSCILHHPLHPGIPVDCSRRSPAPPRCPLPACLLRTQAPAVRSTRLQALPRPLAQPHGESPPLVLPPCFPCFLCCSLQHMHLHGAHSSALFAPEPHSARRAVRTWRGVTTLSPTNRRC